MRTDSRESEARRWRPVRRGVCARCEAPDVMLWVPADELRPAERGCLRVVAYEPVCIRCAGVRQ